MTDFLTSLAALSLGGGAVALVLMAAGRLTRSRYAAKWRCLIWALLCLRLVIPFSLLPQSRGEGAAPIQLTAPQDVILYQRPLQPQGERDIPGQGEGPAQEAPPSGLPADELQSGASAPSSSLSSGQSVPDTGAVPSGFSLSLSQVLAAVWLAGAGAVLIWAAAAHLRFLLFLRRWGSPVTNPATVRLFNELCDQLRLDRRPRLMICQGLRVPMLAGLVRPVLLLPEYLPSQAALSYSMLHELTHYRRRDIWLKALALAACALHWFNPAMWLMTRLVERDTELACDEAALRLLPREQHRAYSQTIVDAVERLKGA